MSSVEVYGHFALITSITESKRVKRKLGWRHIALVEVDPTRPPPSRIDPRLKSIKRIISISEAHAMYTNAGFFMHCRELKRLREKAERWNKLWPLHIMAKDWPHPFPVYAD